MMVVVFIISFEVKKFTQIEILLGDILPKICG